MNAGLGAADDTKDETGGYPLGYSAAEARRLEVQGKYLEDLTADVFRRAGITQGMHILDIGCGVRGRFVARCANGGDGRLCSRN